MKSFLRVADDCLHSFDGNEVISSIVFIDY